LNDTVDGGEFGISDDGNFHGAFETEFGEIGEERLDDFQGRVRGIDFLPLCFDEDFFDASFFDGERDSGVLVELDGEWGDGGGGVDGDGATWIGQGGRAGLGARRFRVRKESDEGEEEQAGAFHDCCRITSLIFLFVTVCGRVALVIVKGVVTGYSMLESYTGGEWMNGR
jgi:hypothetical protein